MLLLLDENLPKKLKSDFAEHTQFNGLKKKMEKVKNL